MRCLAISCDRVKLVHILSGLMTGQSPFIFRYDIMVVARIFESANFVSDKYIKGMCSVVTIIIKCKVKRSNRSEGHTNDK